MSQSKPKIELAVLCEDVREEVNGKNTLVGVFTSDIHVPGFPAALRFALLLAIRFEQGSHRMMMRLAYTGKEAKEVSSVMEPPGEGVAVLIVPTFLLEAPAEGDFHIEVRFENSEWETVVRKHVSVGPVHIGPVLPFAPPPR